MVLAIRDRWLSRARPRHEVPHPRLSFVSAGGGCLRGLTISRCAHREAAYAVIGSNGQEELQRNGNNGRGESWCRFCVGRSSRRLSTPGRHLHGVRHTSRDMQRRGLGSASFVVEVGSNDGYLLQHFVAREIPVLGVDPARNVARSAETRGVLTVGDLFGERVARRIVEERGHADLVVGNNVLAQVPDLNDLVREFECFSPPAALQHSSSHISCGSSRGSSTTRSIMSTSRTSRSKRLARSSRRMDWR